MRLESTVKRCFDLFVLLLVETLVRMRLFVLLGDGCDFGKMEGLSLMSHKVRHRPSVKDIKEFLV
jgi:hypothetical protein